MYLTDKVLHSKLLTGTQQGARVLGRDVCVVPVCCTQAKLLEAIVKGMQVLAMKAIWKVAEMLLFTAINKINKVHNQ